MTLDLLTRCTTGAIAAVALLAPPSHAAPPRITWSERVEIARGEAHQGPWRMNDSAFLYVDDPTVLVDERGDIAVAWVDQSRKDVFFQVLDPDGEKRFREPVNVSRSPKIFSWLPRIVLGPPGRVHVLWQEIVFSGGSHGGEIFFARSTDGGRSFEDPVNLSNSTAGDGKGRLTRDLWHNGSLDLAMDSRGHLHAAWTEYEGALWFRRSTDGGSSFSAPLRIAGSRSRPARGPALAVGADSVVHLAWAVGEDPAADIRLASSSDAGRSFGAPVIVHESDGHQDAPKIAVDGEATLHLVYAESPAGPSGRYQVRYARSSDGARTFEEPREISAPLPGEFSGASFPALGLDGENHLHVLWELFPRGDHRARGLGFTFSTDGGRTFSPLSVVPGSADPALGSNGSRQGSLMSKLSVDATGGIAVVNSTFRRNRTSHVWLFRGRAAAR